MGLFPAKANMYVGRPMEPGRNLRRSSLGHHLISHRNARHRRSDNRSYGFATRGEYAGSRTCRRRRSCLRRAGLKFMGIVHDAERWVLEDGSYVEYRIGNGRLGFHAWKQGPSVADLGAWDMGVEISVWNTATNFEAAAITAVNYMSVDAPCQGRSAGGGPIADYNDNHVDVSDWGVFAQQPERVAGACMAQWHHRQFGPDLVTAGSGVGLQDRFLADDVSA